MAYEDMLRSEQHSLPCILHLLREFEPCAADLANRHHLL